MKTKYFHIEASFVAIFSIFCLLASVHSTNAADPQTLFASVEMSVSPAKGGVTTPESGTLTQYIGVPINITATAASGYEFSSWAVNGVGKIWDPSLKDTSAYLYGNSQIVAIFVEKPITATLSIAVSPNASGTTDPTAGAHTVNVGTAIPITANPAQGYIFKNWTVNGLGSIANPDSPETTVTLTGDATVTANFAQIILTATLTMGVAPDNSGTVSPSVGAHIVQTGAETDISATPSLGYIFDSWTIEGAGQIADPLSPETKVTISNDATVTANFVQIVVAATLTMATSPDESGVTNPTEGVHFVATGDEVSITATPAQTYLFMSWTISGTGRIENPLDPSTTVTLFDNATVTANFAKVVTTATLTMESSPSNGGIIVPDEGDHTIMTGVPCAIKATAAEGYFFSGWAINGNGVVKNPDLSDTIVVLNDDATVTAKFVKIVATATLTMSISPDDSGTTSPATGASVVPIGVQVDINADPADGYFFSGWTISGQGSVVDAESARTKVILDGNATVTANFAKIVRTSELTLAVSSDAGGSINPGAGKYRMPLDVPIEIEAKAAEGYFFDRWTVSGSGTVRNTYAEKTFVTIGNKATVTANFTKIVNTGALTVAVEPEDSGSTNPGIGKYITPLYDQIEIKAIPSAKYFFSEWIPSGSAVIHVDQSGKSFVSLQGTSDGGITAKFIKIVDKAVLTMSASPKGSGDTNPGIGDHTVSAGEWVDIEAMAEDGYIFTNWIVSGNASVEDSFSRKTRIKLLNDATATACFSKTVKTVTLTMAATPENYGSTNPGVGIHIVEAGERSSIEAVPADGYLFVNWTVTGNAEIGNLLSKNTYAILYGDATVTANFAEIIKTANLTMGVSPEDSGNTNPGVGSIILPVGDYLEISAIPSKGYFFLNWAATGGIKIEAPDSKNTRATIYGDAAVNAIFARIVDTATLTIDVSPDDTGSTNPGGGVYTVPVGDSVEVHAIPANGYYFSKWTVAGGATIGDPFAETTNVSVLTDSTVTANFVKTVTTATLAVAVSPYGTGSTDPGIGEHVVPVGENIGIQAVSSNSYYFSNWVVSGGASVKDPGSEKTTVVLSDDATVTANFVRILTTATLTMSISPDGSGTTNLGDGKHVVPVGASTEIYAIPAAGYYFAGWISAGSADIEDPSSQRTSVTLSADATVTANFVKSVITANLMIATSPSGSGSTNPSKGMHTVMVGETVSIKAVPAAGYFFSKWMVAGAADVKNANASNTSIVLSGDAMITANFARIVDTATLTMGAYPDNYGSTNPGVGGHIVAVGDAVEIEAVPANGYFFSKWMGAGSVVIGDVHAEKTTASLSGDATVNAVFEKIVATATLAMTVSPDESGSTNPSVEEHIVAVGDAVEIEASPAEGYYFSNWSVVGDAEIRDLFSKRTSVTLSNDAAVTANFAKVIKTATLTTAVSPANSGLTDPSAGSHTVVIGEHIEITANPLNGYYFEKWTGFGNAEIDDIWSKNTKAVLAGDATLTANFVQIVNTATLTLVSSPEDYGSTNPGNGSHIVARGDSVEIEAVPASSYYFTNWIVSGKAEIDDSYSKKTRVVLSGDSTVTANFEKAMIPAILTMEASPEDYGSTNPGIGQHTVVAGELLRIQAVSAEGYLFKNWTVSGKADIDDIYSETSSVTLSGNATVTANFVQIVSKSTLTMTTFPADSGTTTPSTGSYTVASGENIMIEAVASQGYFFEKWIVNGNADIADLYSAKTRAVISGDAALTANFAQIINTATLTMGVGDDGGGSVNPNNGKHIVPQGESVTINAVPDKYYFFNSWIVSGNAAVADPFMQDTTVKLYGDATVTASFMSWVGTAELKIAVSPENSGTSNPGVGTHLVPVGKECQIDAYPADGYYFDKWIVSGKGVIRNAESPSTFINLSDDATVTANFEKVVNTATLTMSVSPDNSGSVSPSRGKHIVPVSANVEIVAEPANGYIFSCWKTDFMVRIDNSYSPQTMVQLYSDGTVTAVFIKETASAVLTMEVSPDGSGNTTPTLGSHTFLTLSPVEIEAFPAFGSFFAFWMVSGNGYVIDPYSQSSSVILYGDSTVTAAFTEDPTDFVSLGSMLSYSASEVNPDLGEFTVKPSIWGEYTDPLSLKSGKKATVNVLTKVDKKSQPPLVATEWNKTIPLYKSSSYWSSKFPLSLKLFVSPVQSLFMDRMMLKSSQFGKDAMQIQGRNTVLACPSISGISGSYAVPGDEFVVEGMYFGAKAPKLYVECENTAADGKKTYKYLPCVISKEGTYLFTNAAGKALSSCMKIRPDDSAVDSNSVPVGYSSAVAVYPKVGKLIPTGYLILNNGIGLAVFAFPK